jgi:carbon dioxide concentrating mechanism protein CcmO
MEAALGLVSTGSFAVIVGIADEMLKSAGVTLIGYEKIGAGLCTAIVRGKTADVRLAVEAGVRKGKEFDQEVTYLVLPRPWKDLEEQLPINTRIPHLVRKKDFDHLSNQAIGLLETRGFPPLLAAMDKMLKTAEVHLIGYEKIGSGLVTGIVQGHVADVVFAMEAGIQEAQRVGELHAVMIIPRPIDELEQTLPTAAYMLEQLQPLVIPLTVKQPEEVFVEMQDLKSLPKQN